MTRHDQTMTGSTPKNTTPPLTRFLTLLLAVLALSGPAVSTARAQAVVWSQRAVSGPSARSSHAMAYDATRGVTVLFGGNTGSLNAETWEFPCSPPITTQPSSQTTCPSGTATFTVTVAGTNPFTYQWQWQPAGAATAWATLAEGNNAEIGGVPVVHATNVGAATLEVRPLAAYINFAPRDFRCIVSNPCGSVTINDVALTVCHADMTCDGSVDINDLLTFLAAFETGSLIADLDNGTRGGTPDGGVDVSDLLFFLARFEAGC